MVSCFGSSDNPHAKRKIQSLVDTAVTEAVQLDDIACDDVTSVRQFVKMMDIRNVIPLTDFWGMSSYMGCVPKEGTALKLKNPKVTHFV